MKTPRLILRSPLNGDAAMLRNFEERNREHWSRWESTPIDGVKETSGERIKKWMHECKHNQSVRFLILPAENSGQIIGVCNFTQIFRGAFQACYLGYKLDHAFEGQGLMFEALQHTIAYVFEYLKLHRIMANYMPANTRSARLLERLGFSIEGYAEKYLFINNQWQDHVLTALTYEKWASGKA